MAPPTNAAAVSVRHATAANGGGGTGTDDDETCPVCKTTRYFNRDMEFLIHPECYHRMCKTCVERIFKDGPNQCPYAGCHKTLRLRGFKAAYFGDLGVEREVDIRRRVHAVFNKVEDDFEALDSYNDYLYMVECLTDELVNGGDAARARAEARLVDWEARHRAEIERNRKLARESDDARRRREAAEAETARLRRVQSARDEADERAEAARIKEEMLDSLQCAEMGRATEAMNKIILKKRGQKQKQAAGVGSGLDSAIVGGGGGGLSIRGLRDKTLGSAAAVAAAAAAADGGGRYDAYGGLDMTPQRVDLDPAELSRYSSEWLEAIRTKNDFTAGGYSPQEYLTRTLVEAFSGLGVFVDEEKEQGGGGGGGGGGMEWD